jgi:hypothetical protein
MNTGDVSPNEMNAPHDFDDAAVEALLSGRGRDVDAGLADLVGDMRVAYTSIPPALGAELSALIGGAGLAPAVGSASSRRFERMRSSIIAKVGVALAAMFAATGGLAVAHALPAPVQDAASHLHIGTPAHHHDKVSKAHDETPTTVEAPTTTEPDDTNAPAVPPKSDTHDNHGSDVSKVAQDHSTSGCEHGAAVSKVASDGKSQNDGSCGTSTSETEGTSPTTTGDNHQGDDNQGDQQSGDGHHEGTPPTTVDGGGSDSSGSHDSGGSGDSSGSHDGGTSPTTVGGGSDSGGGH